MPTSPAWLGVVAQPAEDSFGEEAAQAADAVVPFLLVAVLIAVAIFAYRVGVFGIGRFVRRYERELTERVERERAQGVEFEHPAIETRRIKRLHAIASALRGIVGVTLLLIVVFSSLSILEVDIGPILAGAGLIGLIVGFGGQKLIEDFLAGIAMLVEDQYGVGDWIDVGDKIGQVEGVGLRATRFRDLDGIVWHVRNGHITQVGNLTQRWARSTMDIPIALDTDIPTAKGVIQRVADELADDPVWGDDFITRPEIWGLQTLEPEGMSIRLVTETKPLRNWDVNRQLRERLKIAFDEHGIRLPAPQLEVGGQRRGAPVPTYSSTVPEPPARPRREPPPPEPMPTHPEDTGEIRIDQGPRARPD